MSQTSKTLKVNRADTKCTEVLIYKDWKHCGYGVTMQAWHEVRGVSDIQREFTVINEGLIPMYIADFSENSAQKFVDLFEL